MNARDEFDKLQRLASEARDHGELELADLYDALTRALLRSDPLTVRCVFEYWLKPPIYNEA